MPVITSSSIRIGDNPITKVILGGVQIWPTSTSPTTTIPIDTFRLVDSNLDRLIDSNNDYIKHI